MWDQAQRATQTGDQGGGDRFVNVHGRAGRHGSDLLLPVESVIDDHQHRLATDATEDLDQICALHVGQLAINEPQLAATGSALLPRVSDRRVGRREETEFRLGGLELGDQRVVVGRRAIGDVHDRNRKRGLVIGVMHGIPFSCELLRVDDTHYRQCICRAKNRAAAGAAALSHYGATSCGTRLAFGTREIRDSEKKNRSKTSFLDRKRAIGQTN
jgi:hypothetical protein